MKDWVTILTFTYPHEAYLAKGKLESEGIDVQITDELTVQVYNFYSNAIGGVKLLVRKSDFEKANQILIDSGYIRPEKQPVNKFLSWIEKFTAKFPLVGKTILEIRLIAFIMIILIIIVTPIVLLSIPSKMKRLTENSWCVDRIYYKGQELTPNTAGFRIVSEYENCSERMRFGKDGTVSFPGFNTYSASANWRLNKDSLIIYPTTRKKLYSGGTSEIVELENKSSSVAAIYYGSYLLKIRNNVISMQSDSLIIIGEVYRFNFSFGF
jgi:hypothetical protein